MTATRHLLSIAFAALTTLGILTGIDHLARPDAAPSSAMLAATAQPRA